ncbi:hypothetical protein CLOSTMETH_00918 [[Clostridium] methylpentosum DSM 5476]|uniref:Uncharacterized protein n=1 Tax=[Clostridium] methylpentosum DSM 5476 TaxID=537013 RepID=C0EAQ4_9FIRM|nr:hypothetical protein CLOSTMETH_00918 [[Clostridium] methylpentosum DSM 5476]
MKNFPTPLKKNTPILLLVPTDYFFNTQLIFIRKANIPFIIKTKIIQN